MARDAAGETRMSRRIALVTGAGDGLGRAIALDLPAIACKSNEVPTALNPLGAKGAGEAGTVGALACVINALVDALRPLGVTHLDMPATAETVWRAMQQAKRA